MYRVVGSGSRAARRGGIANRRLLSGPREFAVAVFCCALLLIPAAPVFGQSAAVSGTVTDQNGGVIPGVGLALTQVATGQKRQVVSNERGEYVVPVLPTGEYEIAASLPGFKTSVRKVELRVDDRSQVNFQLTVGEITEHIAVIDAPPLLQAETSSIGTVIENKRIVELPLNGRDFQNLALLVPGTANPAQGSSLGFRGGIAVAGTRDAMTSFTLDGVDIVNGLVKAISFKPSIDMIQEFKVETSTYSAEYGRTAGGQVVATTKSGTNQFHGTLYEFIRNSALDAKNLFAPAGQATPFKRNNFGFTLGGPIVPDRTFFFGNYEGLIIREAVTRRASVPAPEMVTGDFSKLSRAIVDPLTGQPFPGNVIPLGRMNPVGLRIAQTYPAPNLDGAGTQNFVSTPVDKRDIHQFTVRVDHEIGAKDKVYGRYSFSNDYERDPFDVFSGITNLPGYGRLDDQRAMSLSLNHTHIFGPSLVSEIRLGYNRYKQIRTQEVTDDIPKIWGISGTTDSPAARDHGYPAVRVTNFDAIGKSNLPSDRVDPIYQIIGSITYTNGRHTIKAGGDVNRFGSMRLNNGGGNGSFNFTGVYTGNSLADLLLGYPQSASRSLGDTRNPLWSESFSAYVQDDWKITSRLTLNLGFRYDLQSPYRSTDDRLVRYNPATGNTEIAGSASERRDIGRVDNPLGPFYNAEVAQALGALRFVDVGERNLFSFDHNDFAPRVGLVFRAIENKLVLRTGYGIFYQYLQGNSGQVGWNSLPFFVSQTFNGNVQTSAGRTSPIPNISIESPFPGTLASSSLSVSAVTDNYRTGYVQNYNFGFQLQPRSNVLVDVAYVGNSASKLSASRNINQPVASRTSSIASRRPITGFGNIGYLDSVASSNFNSLQLRVEKRYSGGLTIAGAYTWAKSLDTVGDGDGDSGTPNAYNIRGTMYGLSSSDVRHRLVASYVYDLPIGNGRRFLAGASGLTRWLAGGWGVSGIVTSQSGRPFTVTVAADRSNTGAGGDRPNLVGNPYLPASERTVDRWFNIAAFEVPELGTYGNLGRNTMTGPRWNTTDFSLIKNNKFGEGNNVQFRAEVFNLFNHPNLYLPSRSLSALDPSSAAAGPVSPSSSAAKISRAENGRQIQFGVKVIY